MFRASAWRGVAPRSQAPDGTALFGTLMQVNGTFAWPDVSAVDIGRIRIVLGVLRACGRRGAPVAHARRGLRFGSGA